MTTTAANIPAPSAPTLQRAHEFVQLLMERYSEYHAHKENMAYGGFTVFTGAVVAALVSDAWPPEWGAYTPTLAPGAALAAFVLALVYLKYQLHRRRWAALRVAGCEHVLAQWIQNDPRAEELLPGQSKFTKPIHSMTRLLGWIFPLKDGVRAVTPPRDTDYPKVLVDAWEEAQTTALTHERIIIWATWALGVALVARSWSCPCKLEFSGFVG